MLVAPVIDARNKNVKIKINCLLMMNFYFIRLTFTLQKVDWRMLMASKIHRLLYLKIINFF